ncbi:MAG: SMI1/KNR4 family protein [Paracoccaceae bacterium]
MSTPNVTRATKEAIAEIRRKLEPYGMVEGAFDAFRAGYMPEKGPEWYSATVFNGLSPSELDKLESRLPFPVPEQAKASIPKPLREFLSVTNGLHCHNLSIHGDQGRIDHGAGMPFDLGVPQLVKPPNIPKLWFCFGSMNGPSFSQGTLFFTNEKEIALVHRDTGDIGARWSGLAEFLQTEIPRLLSIHDPKGDVLPGANKLPGNTQSWEEKAELAKLMAAGWRGYLPRVIRWLKTWPLGTRGGRS